jgi:hypothetical protein
MILSMYLTRDTQCSCQEELVHYQWPPIPVVKTKQVALLEWLYNMMRRVR